MLIYSLQMSAVPKQRAQITEWPSGNQFPQNGGVAWAEGTGGEWALVRQVLPGRVRLLWCFDRRKVSEGLGGGLQTDQHQSGQPPADPWEGKGSCWLERSPCAAGSGWAGDHINVLHSIPTDHLPESLIFIQLSDLQRISSQLLRAESLCTAVFMPSVLHLAGSTVIHQFTCWFVSSSRVGAVLCLPVSRDLPSAWCLVGAPWMPHTIRGGKLDEGAWGAGCNTVGAGGPTGSWRAHPRVRWKAVLHCQLQEMRSQWCQIQ